MTQIAWGGSGPIMKNGTIGEAPSCCCGGCCCLAASIDGETGTDDGMGNRTWNIGPPSTTSITGWWQSPYVSYFEGAWERVEFTATCVNGQWTGTVYHKVCEVADCSCMCETTESFTIACDGTITTTGTTSGPTQTGDCTYEFPPDPPFTLDPCATSTTYLAFTPATCCVCQSLTLAAERTLVFTFDKNLFPDCTSPTFEIPITSLATCEGGLLKFETDFDSELCDPDAANTIYCATLTVYFSVDPGCNCETEADCNLTIEAWESSCPGRLVDVSFAP